MSAVASPALARWLEHTPGGHQHNQLSHANVGKLWEDVTSVYGDSYDEAVAGEFTVAVFENGDTALFIEVDKDRYEVAWDGGNGEDLRSLAEALRWASSEDIADDAEGDDTGMVDWQYATDGDVMVGYDPTGDVAMRFPKTDDAKPNDLSAFENFEVGSEEAAELAEALDRMADRYDELEDATEAVSPALTRWLEHRPGGINHDQRSHGRRFNIPGDVKSGLAVSVADLRARADKAGVKVPKRARKADLLKALDRPRGDGMGSGRPSPSFRTLTPEQELGRFRAGEDMTLRELDKARDAAYRQIPTRPGALDEHTEINGELQRRIAQHNAGDGSVQRAVKDADTLSATTGRAPKRAVDLPDAERTADVLARHRSTRQDAVDAGLDAAFGPAPTPRRPEPRRSSEPLRPVNELREVAPGKSQDQGLMHFDSAVGQVWSRLGDDAHMDVRGGRALGNVVGDIGEGIGLGRHTSSEARAQLVELRREIPDDTNAARLIDQAIERMKEPPKSAAPRLPSGTDSVLTKYMDDLNDIPLVRRGGDAMGSRAENETARLKRAVDDLTAGRIDPFEFSSEVRGTGMGMRHESQEGFLEIRRAFGPVQEWLTSSAGRRWMRETYLRANPNA